MRVKVRETQNGQRKGDSNVVHTHAHAVRVSGERAALCIRITPYSARNKHSRLPPQVPDGCLLLQVGKQLEWVTGGVLAAGFHEVVVKEPSMSYQWSLTST